MNRLRSSSANALRASAAPLRPHLEHLISKPLSLARVHPSFASAHSAVAGFALPSGIQPAACRRAAAARGYPPAILCLHLCRGALPADARPCVPVWTCTGLRGEGGDTAHVLVHGCMCGERNFCGGSGGCGGAGCRGGDDNERSLRCGVVAVANDRAGDRGSARLPRCVSHCSPNVNVPVPCFSRRTHRCPVHAGLTPSVGPPSPPYTHTHTLPPFISAFVHFLLSSCILGADWTTGLAIRRVAQKKSHTCWQPRGFTIRVARRSSRTL